MKICCTMSDLITLTKMCLWWRLVNQRFCGNFFLSCQGRHSFLWWISLRIWPDWVHHTKNDCETQGGTESNDVVWEPESSHTLECCCKTKQSIIFCLNLFNFYFKLPNDNCLMPYFSSCSINSGYVTFNNMGVMIYLHKCIYITH